MAEKQARAFYDGPGLSQCGRTSLEGEIGHIRIWLDRLPPQLRELAVLELGCGRGPLRDISPRFVGTDLSLRALASGDPFRCFAADMEELPLLSGSVGFVFSWAAVEHVPHPEKVLDAIQGVLAPGGIAVLKPAWHCRPWAAEGLEFRPYAELELWQRLRKVLIPFRNSLVLRTPPELVRRALRELLMADGKPLRFEYVRLEPNLNEYVGTDCDAFTSLDPHAMLTWFLSRGWVSLSHPSRRSRMLARNEAIVVQKPHGASGAH